MHGRGRWGASGRGKMLPSKPVQKSYYSRRFPRYTADLPADLPADLGLDRIYPLKRGKLSRIFPRNWVLKNIAAAVRDRRLCYDYAPSSPLPPVGIDTEPLTLRVDFRGLSRQQTSPPEKGKLSQNFSWLFFRFFLGLMGTPSRAPGILRQFPKTPPPKKKKKKKKKDSKGNKNSHDD